jgi:antitoxin component of MazEF toxin-antitoxin module
MHRKVFKTGNSTVVSLPREALDFLRLSEGADVAVELDRENRRIVITPAELPVAAAGVDENFARQVAEFIAEYRPALTALAK